MALMTRSAVALAIMAISFSSVLGSAADLGVWPTLESGVRTNQSDKSANRHYNTRVDCVKAGGDWCYFTQTCDLHG